MKHFLLSELAQQCGTPPPVNETWQLTSPYTFNGVTAQGSAYVFYGKNHANLVQPLIIGEGFPGGQSLSCLWETFDQNGFASTLLESGFDLIVLTYPPPAGGPTYIEANAGLAVACIQQANQEKNGAAELVVGGTSMGGLITRYALTYMEQNGIDHQTSLYFSIDTPHCLSDQFANLGALVPASVFYFVNFFSAKDPKNSSLQQIYTILQSPAAQELLAYWLPPYDKHTPPSQWLPQVSPLRQMFINNLANLGGFPSKPYKIGVSDGDGNAQGNTTQPGALALSWETSLNSANAYLYSAPGNSGNTSGQGNEVCELKYPGARGSYYWDYNGGLIYDSAPGGRGDFFNLLAEALQSAGDNPQLNDPQSCFVPAISALAMETNNLYQNLTSDPPTSLLDAYYFSEQNYPHLTITANMEQWLVNHIQQYSSLRVKASGG